MRSSLLLGASIGASLLLHAMPVAAQGVATDPSRLTIDRIFGRGEFNGAPGPSVHWLKDGHSYLDTRDVAAGGQDIVRLDLVTGATTVLATAAQLRDEAGGTIEIEDIQLSDDETRALLFHGSVPVWRANTRGVYHVIDFRTHRLTPVARITTPQAGASTESDTARGRQMLGRQPSFLAPGVRTSLQMFAKFSPNGQQVAFVRDNDLFVSTLASGIETRLTFDGSADVINGTTDWVYEEELGLRDAFRWSPDGTRIAYWRFDQSEVPAFPITNELGVYPIVGTVRYPKAGAPNSRVKIGVLSVASPRDVRWLDVGPDTGQYLARMQWADRDSLVIQRLPRRQNRLDVLMVSASTGGARTVLTDRDSAYVDVEGEAITLLDGGKRMLVRSDRSGWRQLYLYDRAGTLVRQVTKDGADVIDVAAVNEATGDVWVTVAAPTPTQRQLWRYSLDGTRAEQATRTAGTHSVDIGPGARYAVDTYSTLVAPATVTLYELPSMRQVRVLESNTVLKARLAALNMRAPELFRVPMPDGTLLDAIRIVPAGFDSTRKYPVLMNLYGGPAAPQVSDEFGGRFYLWHQMLAQSGYVVVIVDNRGSAFRGRDFRKTTQYQLGIRESQDQIDAAKWLGAQSWVDRSRIGMWGWSYGGFMTAMTLSRGGDLFKAGIVVSPVIDWRLYDTIYTERYMWTPQENAVGYARSSVLPYIGGLRARLLLVHGTGDDNVHLQNTLQFANALEAANKPFYMLLYPNRTHSISGGNTQLHLFESFTRYIKENL